MLYAKVHPLDPQEDVTNDTTVGTKACRKIPDIQEYGKDIKILDEVPRLQLRTAGLRKKSSTKCLYDMLQESESDRSTTVGSCSTEIEEESDSEVIVQKTIC